MQASTSPNLFSFATTELSQDAVLAYILAWADEAHEDDPRHQLARGLIQVLAKAAYDERSSATERHESLPLLAALSDYKTVAVRRQLNKVDVVCFLDPELAPSIPNKIVAAKAAILIEDKTFTSQHSGQLARYLSGFGAGVPVEHVYPIIYKTGLQASYASELRAGFAAFTRKEMLHVLAGFGDALRVDTALSQYFDYLSSLSAAYAEGHSTVPAGSLKEDWFAWHGFLNKLAENLADYSPHWQYVHNAQGGFMGMWWSFRDVNMDVSNPQNQIDRFKGARIYLQLEQDLLTIRATRREGDKLTTNMRWSLHDHVRSILQTQAEAIDWVLVTSGRAGGSSRLLKVLPKGTKSKNGKTFRAGAPIATAAEQILVITKIFEEAMTTPLLVQERHYV